MKFQKLLCILFASVFISCEVTVSNAYLQDVTVDNKGLSCDGIKVLNHTNKNDRTEFSYGESIRFLYDNMTGFALQDGKAYPKMDIYVLTKKGDTLISKPNLFPENDGYEEAELNLRTNFLVRKPMIPNNEYIVAINIGDKYSDAYYNWKRTFSIVQSPLIQTTTKGMRYDVQYLFSQKNKKAIVDNKISLNEAVYLIIEDLDGFDIDEDGNADLQASISLTAGDGSLINENNDLFPNLVNASELREQLYASAQITDPSIPNPITCTVRIKDNRNGNSLETNFELTVEN